MRRAISFLFLLLTVLSTLALAGCSTTTKPANDGHIHAECKVCKFNADMACIDVPIEKDTPHAEYNGTTYYFCSEHCCKKFQATPAKFAKE